MEVDLFYKAEEEKYAEHRKYGWVLITGTLINAWHGSRRQVR